MSYPSLNNQLCIGGVYVRLLLEGGDASEHSTTQHTQTKHDSTRRATHVFQLLCVQNVWHASLYARLVKHVYCGCTGRPALSPHVSGASAMSVCQTAELSVS